MQLPSFVREVLIFVRAVLIGLRRRRRVAALSALASLSYEETVALVHHDSSINTAREKRGICMRLASLSICPLSRNSELLQW